MCPLQVTEMKKEKTALVIPNAVQVKIVDLEQLKATAETATYLSSYYKFNISGLRWNRQVFLHILCCKGQNLCDAFQVNTPPGDKLGL